MVTIVFVIIVHVGNNTGGNSSKIQITHKYFIKIHTLIYYCFII